ncbi:methyl-accepting chemotaxis protein [Pseudomonas sp. 5P_3.1_Bac2]|nr:methyl-accepting chemotaxis protein [Pseudomonas sp. 5P_3.1_Bac2]MCU1718742.1 methyl-accepting chemotaxis protein [Pseudomonas sp. 5P_3.1_Bac2]
MYRAFANLGFRWKIALPILLLASLFIVMSVLAVRGINQVAGSSVTLTNRYLPGISTLLNADRDLYQAIVAERSLLLVKSGERGESLKEDYQENLQQAYERVHKFAAMQPGEQALQLVADFDRTFESWKLTSAEVLRLAPTDLLSAREMSFTKSEEQFQATRAILNKLGEMEDEAADVEGHSAIERGEAVVWQQGLIIAVGLGICLLLVIVVPLLVVGPLQRLLERINQIADGDGDLRSRLEVTSTDELGRLSLAFNRFLDKLQPLILEVGRVTAEVETSAKHLADMAASNDQLIAREHAAVDQVSTAATEMSSAVHEVARNAQSAADAALSAEAQSLDGAQVVGRTIASIRQLALEVEEASTSIQALEQEAASIDAVLSVIRGIAEQTNLLALNAAIEAARAGEQGRGFAVVADEVRALAARTQDSTKDIQQMIERLQLGVQEAVRATHAGSLKARHSVEQAAGVDKALAQTSDSVQRINDMTAQIATACEEQSSVTEEIARSITDIRDLSNEALHTSEQSAQASHRLSELSRNLSELVSRFRV